jgi:hypothetical protein
MISAGPKDEREEVVVLSRPGKAEAGSLKVEVVGSAGLYLKEF